MSKQHLSEIIDEVLECLDESSQPFFYDDLNQDDEKPEVKCECGSDAVGSPRHSEWCPKYRKED